VLQGLETYDANPQKKSYRVFVDGVLVATRLNVRPLRQEGTASYRLHVPAGFVAPGADGKVRIRLQSRSDPDFADPSLADVWALPFMGDTAAPTVTDDVPSGWSRGPVTVTLGVDDDQDESPVLQYGTDAGWVAYTGPFVISTEGTTTVSYRAHDAAGNSTGVRTVDVRIDRVAPQTAVAARLLGETAQLTFTATDATSGIGSTSYRLDGGAWTVAGPGAVEVRGFGAHQVEVASTDVAGNVEPTHTVTVDLRDVDQVAAVVAPQVSGAATVGSTLTASPGSWNTTGLGFAFQWLRNGTPIAGATGATYQPVAADVGTVLGVRVTASKAGRPPGVATSATTAAVARAASTVAVTLRKSTVARGKPVKVTVVVTSEVAPTGTVQVRVDGRTVKTIELTNGRAVVKVRIRKAGQHRVTVGYLGSPGVAPSTSPTRAVRVT
jgi:alpha-L-rhamnosidase